MKENKYDYKGSYDVIILDKNGKEVQNIHIKNRITDIMLDRLADLLSGDNSIAPKLISFALGDTADDTPEDGSSTILKSEVAREPILNNRTRGLTGKLVTFVTFNYDDIGTPPDVNDNKQVTEVGVFALDGVSAEGVIENTIDTGLMISRILIDELVPEQGVLQIVRTDEFRRL